jgi:copper chaperone
MSSKATEIIEFKISGMDCGHCVTAIESAVGGLPGVETVKVSLDTNSATVEFDPGQSSKETVFEAVEDTGYDVTR